ncbi:MAG: hypothetical protein IMY76_04370 [Chloroflexi bacterium]|nr:hypothetical protein [Chloroflexota bacterium]
MKIKKILLTCLILILTLTACNSGVTEPVDENSPALESNAAESGGEIPVIPENTGNVMLNTDYANAVPVQMQLLLGTVKLEETKYPIGAEQATDLLPLWKVARSLDQSDTAAAEEMDAIVNQIAETMTSDQLEAIVTMQLSQDDLTNLAESLGIEIGSGGKFGDMTPEEIEAARAALGDGQQPPGGGVPGAGPAGGPPVGNTSSGNQVRGGATSRINPMFFDAIIELLEVKVQ